MEIHRTDWTIEELDKLPTLSVIFKGPIEVGTEFNGLKITSTEAKVSTKYGEFYKCYISGRNRGIRTGDS